MSNQSVIIVDNKCDILHHLPRQMKGKRLAIEKKFSSAPVTSEDFERQSFPAPRITR
jgi:hypothetical protein